MATYPVIVNGPGTVNPPLVRVNKGTATIIWTTGGPAITSITIGGGWPYAQPSAAGNGTWSVTYVNDASVTRNYPYNVGTAIAAEARPERDETPEIQNQGGGGFEPEAEA